MKVLNICIENLKHHPIRVVKQLFNEEIIVFSINNNSIDKLHSNNKETFILENNLQMVICIYNIMINEIEYPILI